jgi:hypothetical protein
MWGSFISIGLAGMTSLQCRFCREWCHKISNAMFPLSKKQFGLVMYLDIGGLKLMVWVFFLIPWIALEIIS